MPRGLSAKEVQERIENNQINAVNSNVTKSYKEIIMANVFTFFNLINVVLFALVVYVQSYRNGLFFFTIVANTCVGIFQEVRSKCVLDKLSILTMNKIDVYRDNKIVNCCVEHIVLGDYIVLREGMQVPSDSIITEGRLELNEALLTGESVPQNKIMDDELFSGSYVTSGEAICKVVRVGSENFATKIVREAKKSKARSSDLKNSIDSILKAISCIILPVGVLLFCNQYWILKFTFKDAVVSTVAAVIGMIPEGLVFLTSVALAISIMRLAAKRTLVQDLYSVETLARVDTLCLDKTGTLTEGKMKVIETCLLEDADIHEIMGNYCSVYPRGNATIVALNHSFEKYQNYEALERCDFSADRKYSAITFKDQGTYYLGAAQSLFPDNAMIQKITYTYAEEGNRILFLGHACSKISDLVQTQIRPIACFKIQDKIRATAAATIHYFYEQDVACKIISGDDPVTVSMIAAQVGLRNADEWVDASKCTDDELKELVLHKTVFGRVKPHQKKMMIEALQKMNHVVAMTGDGVNDVPALKQANASIAMASGSDAAKNSADIVLLDSDFSSLPSVVNEGRRVINNIRSASSMFLVKTAFSVVLSVVAIVLLQGYPFQPIQLTIIGVFSVGLPTFLLQFEPSFHRVDGKFVSVALKNALPSALAIVVAILLGMGMHVLVKVPSDRISTFYVIQTAIIYTCTLYLVYSPWTKYRVLIIASLQIALILVFMWFGRFLGLTTLGVFLIFVIICYSMASILLIKVFKGVIEQLIKSFSHSN